MEGKITYNIFANLEALLVIASYDDHENNIKYEEIAEAYLSSLGKFLRVMKKINKNSDIGKVRLKNFDLERILMMYLLLNFYTSINKDGDIRDVIEMINKGISLIKNKLPEAYIKMNIAEVIGNLEYISQHILHPLQKFINELTFAEYRDEIEEFKNYYLFPNVFKISYAINSLGELYPKISQMFNKLIESIYEHSYSNIEELRKSLESKISNISQEFLETSLYLLEIYNAFKFLEHFTGINLKEYMTVEKILKFLENMKSEYEEFKEKFYSIFSKSAPIVYKGSAGVVLFKIMYSI